MTCILFTHPSTVDNISIEEIVYNGQDYNCILSNDMLTFCTNIDKFIIANLHNLIDKLYWFIYSNNFLITESDMWMLFEINKSRTIITLNLFNQKKNELDSYGSRKYDGDCESDFITPKYCKKFISCFILKSKMTKFIIELNNYNKNYYNNHLTELFMKTEDELQLETDISYSNTLSFGDQYEPFCTFESINHMFTKCMKPFIPELQYKLKKEYTGVLIYEDKINTNLNIVEVIDYICRRL